MKHFRVLAEHPKGEIVSSGCDYATATLLVGLLRMFGASEVEIVHNHGPARRRAEELQASGTWFVISLGSCKACSGESSTAAAAVTKVPMLQLPPGVAFLPPEPAEPAKRKAENRKSEATAGEAPEGMPAWAWWITKGAVRVLVTAVCAAIWLSYVPGNVWRWVLGEARGAGEIRPLLRREP